MKGMKLCGALASLALLASVAAVAAEGGGDGKELFEKKCTLCHAASRALSAKKDAAGWKATVARMKGKGAQVDDEEAAAIERYLVESAGK